MCKQFCQLQKGKLVNLTEKLCVNEIPAAVSDLKGRRKDMFELIQNICSGQRLVQLLGVPGIGKSSLIRSVLQCLLERRVFLGGMVFIQGTGIKTKQRLLKQIVLKVFIRADKAKIDKINLTSLDAITDEIII